MYIDSLEFYFASDERIYKPKMRWRILWQRNNENHQEDARNRTHHLQIFKYWHPQLISRFLSNI